MAVVFFYDQLVLLKRKKRHRKLPDELPRSLRFANLPPTLAAFLTSQERQKQRQEGGEYDEFGGLFGDNDDGDGRRDFLLPNLNNDAQVFRRLRRRGSDDSLSSLDGEYSQKQHYHEAVSIAPTVLVQLSSILYLFKNEHLDLPRELVNDLEGHYKDLTTQVQYGNYKWQCTQNILKELQEQNEAREAREAAEEAEDGDSKENGDKTDMDKMEKKKKRRKKLEGGGGEGGHNGKEIIQSGATHGGKAKSKKSHGKMETAGAGARRASSFIHQKENSSTGDNQTETPQGGGGVHQPNFLQVVSFSMSSKVCEDKGWILQESEKDTSQEDKEQRNILEICLERLRESLTLIKIDSSRYRNLGHDKTLFTRYYGDTKREQMQKYISKKSTSGKSPSFMNTNKGLIPRMVMSTPDPGQKQLFHHSLHDSSATSLCSYPSGNVAVIVSRAGLRMPGAYTLLYNDGDAKTLLACFTPTGHGCSYHPNGLVKFLSTEKEGILFDIEGAVTKKWDWVLPHHKLSNPVLVSINDHFTLRCNNRNQMTLVFTNHKESVKLQVGQVLSALEPVTQEELMALVFTNHKESIKLQVGQVLSALEPVTQEEQGYLVTEEDFQSKSAEECIKPPPPPPVSKKKLDKKNKRLSRQVIQPPPKPVFQMSDIVKSLEMEEPTEYGIPAEKELARISRKIKNICDNWFEHYRIAVGIRSPHLSRIRSAVPHHRKRGIHSAKPTMDKPVNTAQGTGSVAGDEQLDESCPAFLLPRTTPLIRSPSAPPVSYAQRRPYSTMSTMSRQSRQPTSSPNRLKSANTCGGDRIPRIEFDTDVSYPAAAGQRPATALSLKSGTIPMSQTPHTAWSASPTRTAASTPTPSLKQRKMKPLVGCPIALRGEMLGDTNASCRCSRHKVPSIGDLELDRFLRECVPRTQLIVIAVVSALFPEALPCHDMFSKFYDRQQRNRTKPCYQSRTDPYRLLVYDVISAVHLSGHKQPFLLQRHNAVPGMFLIFAGAKLVFCDHIFNGYGNAKRDFQKQLLQSRQDSSLGNFLPADFRFSPSRGRRGLRSAWGGEIGGTGVERHIVSGLPSVFSLHNVSTSNNNNNKRIQSADTRTTTRSPESPKRDRRHIDTAADFLSLSLSHTNNNLVALAL